MDLPDCPPGAEGYEDSVVEKPKKPDTEESKCTKAEQEFQDHLNSLKIKLENGEARCMVERRGRDISGKWIYLCYPCAAVCSGESILQTHISGKKHKTKLALKSIWPMSIFDDHPFNQNQKGGVGASAPSSTVLQKMAAEVDLHNQPTNELDHKFAKYRRARCHLQDTLDTIKTPLLGVEYLLEHPPDQPHYEPRYVCTLCMKQGHPRTIINHLTCFWHRYHYLMRHFPKAIARLAPYKSVSKYREGVSIIMARLAQRIEDLHGRMKPTNIDCEEYERDKEQILQWLFKGPHCSEKPGMTLEEVVDTDLIESIALGAEKNHQAKINPPMKKKKDPSPPVVAAPLRPHHQPRRDRRISMESLSDISDDDNKRPNSHYRPQPKHPRNYREPRGRYEAPPARPEPRPEPRRSPESHAPTSFRSRYAVPPDTRKEEKPQKPPNYEHKLKMATERRVATEEAAKTLLAYHEKNPEKHPLYPEEWKKFWNKRYKEIQAEGKDPAKHDFKPEWIVFWTKRMKELHEEELRVQILEIYRRLNMPDEMTKMEHPDEPRPQSRKSPDPRVRDRRRSPEPRRRPPSPRWRSPEPRRRSPEPRRRSPEPRRRSPEPRRRSPEPRRRSPEPRRRSPLPRRSPDYRRMSQEPRRRSPGGRPASRNDRSPLSRRNLELRLSPLHRTRSRSPLSRRRSSSRSPLSRRESALRNRSPAPRPRPDEPARARSPRRDLAPSLQTVLISDDELKPDDGLSPWNSDNEIDSVCSFPAASHAGSTASKRRAPDLGPHDNIVATLRVLVALEDYLGSLGPKIVDLLTEALKMEKEKANSSEELLERESALVLIETAKEKLKGAAQAGLVPAAAAPAVRAAVLRAAGALHDADTRAKRRALHKKPEPSKSQVEAVPVAGVGAVDRAQIAQQMAAALIAQGKTDVTSAELEQLVDAVVGMAEAKKRAEPRPPPPPPPPPAKAQPPPPKKSGTATALQMLQTAYDENDKSDKKVEKEDAPDAMDGLSDSDLETLLKNFNELSAEEQHSLIAYLKKLEAREPARVERLRQYVSAAAAPPAAHSPAKADLVAIESDDDDYTVDEVFQSATQKVKEDQIRKELDIVKKSLEESKEDEEIPPAKIETVDAVKNENIAMNSSSASDLFALVQASLKSTAPVTPAAAAPLADVVSTHSMPRSFGDAPEMGHEPVKPSATIQPALVAPPLTSLDRQTDRNMSNPSNFNSQNDQFNQNDQFGQNQQFNQQDQYAQNQQYNQNDYANTNNDQWNANANDFSDNNSMPIGDQGYNNYDQSGNFVGDQPNQYAQDSNWEQNSWQDNSAPTQDWSADPEPPQIWQDNATPQDWQPNNTQNWQGNAPPNQGWQNNMQPNQFNPNRGNFMNGNRPPFNNQKQFNNFRGRGGGRGKIGGGPRGRGRGRF